MPLISAVTRTGMAIAALLLAAITIGVIYDVGMRYFFNSPTLWNVEYTGYALGWMGLFAAGEIMRKGEHIHIMLLTSKLSPAGQNLAARLSALVMFVVTMALGIGGIGWAWDTYVRWEVSDSVLQTAQFYVRLPFPLGMFSIALASLPGIIAPAAAGGEAEEEWKLHS